MCSRVDDLELDPPIDLSIEPIGFDPVKPQKLRSFAQRYGPLGSPSIAYLKRGVGTVSVLERLGPFNDFKRRLAACFNFMAGTSTDEIEAMVLELATFKSRLEEAGACYECTGEGV
jgi:hypothetical protein